MPTGKREREPIGPVHTYAFRAQFIIARPKEDEPTELKERKLIPTPIYNRGQAMRRLWNECVTLHDSFLDGLPDLLPSAAQQLIDERIDLLKSESGLNAQQARKRLDTLRKNDATLDAALFSVKSAKDAAYAAFTEELYDLCDNRGAELELGSSQKWHVHRTFKSALQAFWKGQREKPKQHYTLDRIYIPYINNSGGWKFDWLWNNITPVPDEAYEKRLREENGSRLSDEKANRRARKTAATIPLDKTTVVKMTLWLHERIPAGAVIKRLAISGEQIKPFDKPGNWIWHLLVTVEMPAGDYYKELPATHRAAGIDFGWRAREDGIRVALVYDGHRAWEFVIAYDLASNNARRFQRRLAAQGRTVELSRNWREIFILQNKRDEAKDACKDKLRQYDPSEWPSVARRLAMMGLRRQCWIHGDKLAYDKKDRIYRCPRILDDDSQCPERNGGVGLGGLRAIQQSLLSDGITIPMLDQWLERDTELAQRIRNAQIRTEQRRDYLYQLFAYWLVQQFDVLAWEGDLDLAELARGRKDRKAQRRQEREETGDDARPRTGNEIALDTAEKNRQFASLHKLRGCIQQAFRRYQRYLLDAPTAYSTQTCAICGLRVAPGAQLTLTCELNHSEDQDVIAGTNYYYVAADELREPAVSGASVDLSQLQGILRPLS